MYILSISPSVKALALGLCQGQGFVFNLAPPLQFLAHLSLLSVMVLALDFRLSVPRLRELDQPARAPGGEHPQPLLLRERMKGVG